MRNILRRKPTTILDVIAVDTLSAMPAGDPDSDLGPDEAYDSLVDLGLVRKSVPAAELIARINSEQVA